MKKILGSIVLLLAVSAVAVFFATETNILDNLTPYLQATALPGSLSCALQSDSASPPNISIKSITGGSGNYECNLGEEISGFDVFSAASCSTPHPSNCTGIGNCPVVASVRDIGVNPKTYASCSISVTGQGIPATGCPSGFQLNNGVCGIISSTSTPVRTGGGKVTNTATTTSAQLPQSSTSIGQIQFGKVFFDTTNLVNSKNQNQLGTINNDGTYIPEAQDLAIAKFGNKNFLFVLTGGAIDTYNLADPLNPKYVGSADAYSQAVQAFSPATMEVTPMHRQPRTIFKKIEVLDNFNYGIAYGSYSFGDYGNSTEFITIFKINPDNGSISYTAFYNSQTNNPYGLTGTIGTTLSRGMGLFKGGSKVYLVSFADDKNYDPQKGAPKHLISIFDFTDPESGISLLYQFPGVGDFVTSGYGGYYPIDIYGFNIINSGGKNYLLISGNAGSSYDNDFGYVHAGTDWSFIFDLSDPSSPKQVVGGKDYQLYGWFDYCKGGCGLALNNINTQYIFDPTNGRLYVTSGITQGDSLMGKPLFGFESRFNLNVMDFSNFPTLKKISDIVLAAQKYLDTYAVAGPQPSIIKPFSGFIDFEYMNSKSLFGATSITSTSTTIRLSRGYSGNTTTGDCYNNQFAQFGIEKNGVLTYIADPTNELDKAKDAIQNKDRAMSYGFYGNENLYCELTPTAVAILPVNSNTLAVYRARTLYAEVDKVTLSSSVPTTTSGGANNTPTGTITTQPATTQSSSVTSPFSFQSLLNIFKRVFGK